MPISPVHHYNKGKKNVTNLVATKLLDFLSEWEKTFWLVQEENT